MSRMIFPNLPVTDVQRSRDFWTGLGFEFNDQFSDENAACLVINELASVMLLRTDFFHSFHNTQPHTGTSVLIAVSTESRDEVDALCEQAAAGGARFVEDGQEQGPMYSRSFADPDGHIWEIMWMDMAAMAG
ncbi:VOC family protein [Nocardioides daejeonensis]|uniref:VOC family protein n=1 Tax=Nocardioides daejeonensis TaxID=1046556 RepID=UPI000D74692B|nr:VOC family protein [Nocardioides daejeonensis]